MYLESINIPIDDLNILWNQRMLPQILKDYGEIIFHIEKLTEEKGIKFRAIVDINEGIHGFSNQ